MLHPKVARTEAMGKFGVFITLLSQNPQAAKGSANVDGTNLKQTLCLYGYFLNISCIGLCLLGEQERYSQIIPHKDIQKQKDAGAFLSKAVGGADMEDNVLGVYAIGWGTSHAGSLTVTPEVYLVFIARLDSQLTVFSHGISNSTADAKVDLGVPEGKVIFHSSLSVVTARELLLEAKEHPGDKRFKRLQYLGFETQNVEQVIAMVQATIAKVDHIDSVDKAIEAGVEPTALLSFKLAVGPGKEHLSKLINFLVNGSIALKKPIRPVGEFDPTKNKGHRAQLCPKDWTYTMNLGELKRLYKERAKMKAGSGNRHIGVDWTPPEYQHARDTLPDMWDAYGEPLSLDWQLPKLYTKIIV
jgi:hypothetical protein